MELTEALENYTKKLERGFSNHGYDVLVKRAFSDFLNDVLLLEYKTNCPKAYREYFTDNASVPSIVVKWNAADMAVLQYPTTKSDFCKMFDRLGWADSFVDKGSIVVLTDYMSAFVTYMEEGGNTYSQRVFNLVTCDGGSRISLKPNEEEMINMVKFIAEYTKGELNAIEESCDFVTKKEAEAESYEEEVSAVVEESVADVESEQLAQISNSDISDEVCEGNSIKEQCDTCTKVSDVIDRQTACTFSSLSGVAVGVLDKITYDHLNKNYAVISNRVAELLSSRFNEMSEDDKNEFVARCILNLTIKGVM